MSYAIDIALRTGTSIQLAPPSDLQAAELAYRDLRKANLLDMTPPRRLRAIRTMAQAKIIIALERDDVREAIAQRAAELGDEVPLEERLAIVKHFVPDAFSVSLV